MPTTHSGFMFQSTNKATGDLQDGNFEIVVPSLVGGLNTYHRPNDMASKPWSTLALTNKSGFELYFGHGASGHISGVSIIESSTCTSNVCQLEAVVILNNTLLHYYRDTAYRWHGPFLVANQIVIGNPALIQRLNGSFELIASLASGGMLHLRRSPNSATWQQLDIFGQHLKVEAVALIESDFTNLEVIARVGGQLHTFYFNNTPLISGPLNVWTNSGQVTINEKTFTGATGVPGFIQSLKNPWEEHGTFEVVTSLSETGAGIKHLYRTNNPPGSWTSLPDNISIFGQGQSFSAVALLRSQLSWVDSNSRSLEVAARYTDNNPHNETAFFYRSEADYTWSNPSYACADLTSEHPASLGRWTIPYVSGVGSLARVVGSRGAHHSIEGAVGIHAALLNTGKVLFFGYKNPHGAHHGDGTYSVLDPSNSDKALPEIVPLVAAPHGPDNPFCAGQVFLPNGNVLIVGGHTSEGIKNVRTFAPFGDTGSWEKSLQTLETAHWYPTCTTLPDGNVFILGGAKKDAGTRKPDTCNPTDSATNKSYQIFNSGSNQLEPQEVELSFLDDYYSMYPFVYVVPPQAGRPASLFVHTNNKSWLLDLTTFQPVAPTTATQPLLTKSPWSRTYPYEGSSVLLPLLPPNYDVRIMVIGGSGASCITTATGEYTGHQAADGSTPATNECEILRLNTPTPSWESTPAMQHQRVMPDAVLLPNQTLLVMNGSSEGYADNGSNPVLATELFDAKSERWQIGTPLSSMRIPRLYHSTALLLPDGRVLTAGKDAAYNPSPFNYSEYRVEIFEPPYYSMIRPQLSGVPSDIVYASAFSVNSSADATSAVLMAPGAVTHSFDFNQRCIVLATPGGVGSGTLSLQAPPNEFVAPPGYYLLFVLNEANVPSVGRFVHLSF